MDRRELNINELQAAAGGAGGNLYVFTAGEMIWADTAHRRYFHVNEDVSTDQAERMISVTQVTPDADMFGPQQITMSVWSLKDYLDRCGRRC